MSGLAVAHCGLRPPVLILASVVDGSGARAAPVLADLIRDWCRPYPPLPATNFCTRLPVDASPT